MVLAVSVLLAGTLLIPSVSYSIQAAQGLIALSNSVKELKAFDLQKARISSTKALNKLDNLPATPKPILLAVNTLNIPESDISILLNSAKNVAEIVQNVSKMDLLSLSSNENILGVSTITSDKTDLDRTVELIDSVEGNIQSLKTTNHTLQLQIDKISRDLKDNKSKLIKFKNIQTALPILLGSNAPQKYLILFQNSNELRATGGFIGSYGIINVQDGKISIDKIDDIYNPDGQLELDGQGIFAPAAFTKAFGVDYIYMRDANWDPDFKKSAKQISVLYEKATGEKVDGVIGLDLIFIKNLLNTTGELKLPTYNETITADNFFSKTQSYSEKDFFPGSNQKPAFLNDLSMALIERILSKQALNKDLVLSIFDSLETKDILVYHNDTKALSALQQNNWAGGLDSVKDDYLLMIDSNVGANKANLFIKRSIEFESYKPQRDSGYVRKVRIKYRHTGTTDIWPGGNYINHLRIYVPKDAFLNAAYIIDNHGARTNISKSVDVFAYADKAVYETDLLIKVGETRTIEFEYESAKKYFDDNVVDLTIQKQPGTENDLLTILYHFPYGTTDYENDVLKIDSDLAEDRSFQIPL